VCSIEDIFDDEHFRARDAIVEVEDEELGEYEMAGVFPKLSETPGEVKHPGPELGEHALEVLQERTSLTEAEIRRLADRGATKLS
jgi:formyl-CoA transferase